MPDLVLPSQFALSVKQPWAALLAAGRKTIEIRTWGTRFRGAVLIHAGKIPDNRPEAWAWIDTPELVAAAQLKGGVIGEATVFGCRMYGTKTVFANDRESHLNETSWFQPPLMYGFEFRNARPIQFTPVKGQTLFFTVKGFAPQ